MRGYSEVFKPKPRTGANDPGRIFYTITQEDIGKHFIDTTAGKINLAGVIGYVQNIDVGRRLIRVPNNAGDSWFWQCEGIDQRDARLARESKSSTSEVCGECGRTVPSTGDMISGAHDESCSLHTSSVS